MSTPPSSSSAPALGKPLLSGLILGGVVLVVLAMLGLYLLSRSRTNHVALAAAPMPVTVVKAQAGAFQEQKTYVGMLAPWVGARVGPQYISAYVATVLVRPGDVVKQGQVLATLDCKYPAAESRVSSARAAAIEQRQVATEHESERVDQLIHGGFASANEVEQISARSKAEAAELESQRAALVSKTLAVNDCVLKAPFSGDIAMRLVDPGAYVHPGDAMITMVDRSTIRVVVYAPEGDWSYLAPGTEMGVAVSATGQKLSAKISRRSAAADAATRTIEFEIDVPNAERTLPSDTTATLTLDAGRPKAAVLLPSPAATIGGSKASLFIVVDRAQRSGAPSIDGHAKRLFAGVVGERDGTLYVDPAALPAGSEVVEEGQALLKDGDAVTTQPAQE